MAAVVGTTEKQQLTLVDNGVATATKRTTGGSNDTRRRSRQRDLTLARG